MRNLLFFICLLSLSSFAQQKVKIDTIVFTETVDNSYKSDIPFVVDIDGNQNNITTKINEVIKGRFNIDSFNPNEIKEFRWYEVSFKYEIKNNILLISYSGEYYGAYTNYITENLYFNLSNGELLDNLTIPFCALFSLDGYFAFLNKYWIVGCSREMQQAEECSESKPYCSILDIVYKIESNQLKLSLTEDCFPHVLRACSPYFDISVQLDSLKPYLSNFGEFVLFNSEYVKGSQLDKYGFTVNYLKKITQNYFIIGKIDGKYSFSMAISESDNSNKILGYYYYDKNKVKITLNGIFEANKIKISESLNGENTGHMELTWNSSYQKTGLMVGDKYLTGKWYSSKRDKVMDIIFEEVKLNK